MVLVHENNKKWPKIVVFTSFFTFIDSFYQFKDEELHFFIFFAQKYLKISQIWNKKDILKRNCGKIDGFFSLLT